MAIILTLNFITATATEPISPFVAVLRSQDRGTVVKLSNGSNYCDWDGIPLDYNQPLLKWSDLDKHLQKIKELAGDRTILLEMQVHGDDYLVIDESKIFPKVGTIYLARNASMGYLVNHIEKYLDSNKLVVIMDTCFAPSVYKNTIRNNKYEFGSFIEDCYHVPRFPIYGIDENIISWNNVVFLQYYMDTPAKMVDLRKYEYADTGPKDKNSKSKDCVDLYNIWLVLINSIK